MRIVYLSDDLAIHDERFLQKLTENGYDTWLVTYYNEAQVPDPIRNIRGLHIIHTSNRAYAARFNIEGEYLGLESNGWRGRVHAVLGLWQCLRHFRQVISKIKPDLIHAGWIYSSGFIAAMSGFRPWLLMPWGSDVQVLPYQSLSRRLMAKYVMSRADMITCDCQAVKEHILSLSGYSADRIIIAPWGIDLHHFRPKTCPSSVRARLGWEKQKVLIVTRQLKSIYGIQYLISAMPIILKSEPHARLLICGDGPFETRLRDMVCELALEKTVHFAGSIPNSVLPEYLNAADIYVSPSLTDGASLSLMEAMACGLPAVVSHVPAILEWVKDSANGHVVPQRDVDGLAAAVLNLLGDASLRSRMGSAALATAQVHANWDTNFGIIENIYDRLLEEHRTA